MWKYARNDEARVVGPWQSSQRAELTAILHSCFKAGEARRPLLIRTDSQWSWTGCQLLLAGYPPSPL